MWRIGCPQFHSPFGFAVWPVRVALLAVIAFPLATATEAEAQFRGFALRKIPKVSAPRVPRVAVPKTPSIAKVPHVATPKLPKPPITTGSIKKPVLPTPPVANKIPTTPVTNQLSTATRQLSNPSKALTTAAKPGSAPKADQWGWSDCHSRGGVWGANASCGHPTFGGGGGSGSGGWNHRPRLVAIPWFVPIVPYAFVDPLPCPSGFEKVGETFYGGTKCAPIVGQSPPPPPPPLARKDDDGSPPITAFADDNLKTVKREPPSRLRLYAVEDDPDKWAKMFEDFIDRAYKKYEEGEPWLVAAECLVAVLEPIEAPKCAYEIAKLGTGKYLGRKIEEQEKELEKREEIRKQQEEAAEKAEHFAEDTKKWADERRQNPDSTSLVRP